jgi:type I restriction enzyme S subunit
MKEGATLSLPKGWEIKKLGDVCDTGAGGTPLKTHKDYYEGGTIPWLLSGEVSQGEIFEAKNFITEKGLKNSSAKLFPPNTVLVAMYGATAGQVGILRFEAATNQAVCGILPNDKAIPEFLFYCFLSKKEELVAQAVGGAQPNISQIKIKNTKIPLPPLPEQQRIVSILDRAFTAIDKAKANAEQNLQNSAALFESYLQGVFENGDWDKITLNEIAENLDSKRVPITKNRRESGDIPYYGASGIVDYVADYLFDEDLLCISEDGANLLARTYPIAFSISGKTWVNNHAHVLKFSELTTQKFVETYINSIRIDEYVSGMAQPKLNQRMLNKIPIPLPTIEEREALVDKFDALRAETKKLEAVYQKKMEDLEELKKSILQKAFAGELEIEKALAV